METESASSTTVATADAVVCASTCTTATWLCAVARTPRPTTATYDVATRAERWLSATRTEVVVATDAATGDAATVEASACDSPTRTSASSRAALLTAETAETNARESIRVAVREVRRTTGATCAGRAEKVMQSASGARGEDLER
jgi:hypothetical protein